MKWEEVLLSVAIGVLTGLAASALFYWLTVLRRPKLTVSDKVVYGNKENPYYYKVKVLNRSKFEVVNLTYALYYRTTERPEWIEMCSTRSLARILEPYGEEPICALVLKFHCEPNESPKSIRKLRFVLYGDHKNSGVKGSVIHDYEAEDIEYGQFDDTNSLEVKPKIRPKRSY